MEKCFSLAEVVQPGVVISIVGLLSITGEWSSAAVGDGVASRHWRHLGRQVGPRHQRELRVNITVSAFHSAACFVLSFMVRR